jgi:hypothetical protein
MDKIIWKARVKKYEKLLHKVKAKRIDQIKAKKKINWIFTTYCTDCFVKYVIKKKGRK